MTICHDCGRAGEMEYVDGEPYCKDCYLDNRNKWNVPHWDAFHIRGDMDK